MKLKRIIDIAYHRNGISGAPFHVILFKDTGEEASRKMAIVFRDPHYVAVLDVDKLHAGNITFAQNSWRGDVYEPELRKFIQDHDETVTESQGGDQ